MKFLTLLIATLISMSAHAGFITGTLHTRDDNSKAMQAVFSNNYNNTGSPFNQWVTIDTTTLCDGSSNCLPTGVKGIFVSGILIITHGTTNEACDLNFAARAYGDLLNEGNSICQTIEPFLGGGQRSGCSTWIPVVNDKFQIYQKTNTPGTWPDHCSYGINLVVQAYVD